MRYSKGFEFHICIWESYQGADDTKYQSSRKITKEGRKDEKMEIIDS